MLRFAIHGVEIEVEGEAAAEVGRALAGLAGASPGTCRPDLVLEVRRSEQGAPVPGPTVFVHRPLRGARQGDALAVGDGRSLFVIAHDGRRVEALLAPEALADGGRWLSTLHLPVVLAFALRHHGVFHVHAAALEHGGRAVLVAGQGGAGKTTLAMAMLEAGLGCLGDDAVFLAEREGAPSAQGVLRPFHVRPATLAAFPVASARAGPCDDAGRREVDAASVWPHQLRAARLRPGLLVFPEVGSGPETVATRLSPADALGCLVEASALLVVDGAARSPEHLALLGRLASGAPALRVRLGEDLLRRPAEVARRILDAAGT